MSLQDNQGPYTWRDTWDDPDDIAGALYVLAKKYFRARRYKDAGLIVDAALCIFDLTEDVAVRRIQEEK